MAHRISTRDPPGPSFCSPDRRKSTKSRHNLRIRTTTESGLTPAAAPNPQNAQRSKNRSRLEFHKIAHSFPDYGSVKGAVRMPGPFSFSNYLPKLFAPATHLDTLNSAPSHPPLPSQPSTARTPGLPSAPKRQKLHPASRRKGRDDEIVDIEQDATSRTERHGSQSSFAQSVSPGITEYLNVEASTKQTGRSNRRSRQPNANFRRDIPRELESIESFDELGPAPKSAPQRTARLVSTKGGGPSAPLRDAADHGILGKPARPNQRSGGLNKGKKRTSHEITDDLDELAEEVSGGGVSKLDARIPAEDSAEQGPPSLSRRGDLKATKWESKMGTTASGFAVQAAVCYPNLRYGMGDEQSPCFLRPIPATELRAFTAGGNKAVPYDWLKITAKAKILSYHPESSLIRIKQATDQASLATIGALMMLKLCSNAEASRVARWAHDNLKIIVDHEESDRLMVMWDRVNQAISQTGSQASVRRLSDGGPAPLPRRVEESPTIDSALRDTAPTSYRTPIRHQMQVSAEQHTPSLLGAGSSDHFLPSRTRSSRSRQAAQPKPETPIHRWSEEHPEWAAAWKMPLIFQRTTVDKEDIPRLDEGQCLNDNLIGFGLRYLFDRFKSRQEDLQKRVYLHNSFFYEKLKAGRGAINYDGVKNWTAKVDLLSYDYIIVPVNEHYHWWVAIICNPGKLDPDMRGRPRKTDGPGNEAEDKAEEASGDVEMTDVAAKPSLQSPGMPAAVEPAVVKSDIVDLVSDDKNVSIDLTSGSRAKQTKKSKPGGRTYNPEDPRIITLDSLGSTHSNAINHLKKYLLAEFEDKRDKVITDTPVQLGMRATNIPEQNNLCDCGVYLLGYIQEFVKDPDLFIQTLLRKERPDWQFDPSELRRLWRDTILMEHKSYQANQAMAAQMKRDASAAKRTPKGSAEPSRHTSRATSEITNSANGQRKIGADFPGQPSFSKPVSPVNLDAPEDNDPIPGPAPLNPQPNGDRQSPASAETPQQQHPQQTSPGDDVLVLPPQEEDVAVLPSIEAPEAEERHGRSPSPQDEPRFIPQLGSQASSEDDTPRIIDPPAVYLPNTESRSTSSAQKRARPSASFGEGDDHDNRAAINPGSFYTSNGGSSSAQKRTALSSPAAAGQRRRPAAAKTRANQNTTYTSSRLAVADGADLDPVVERAEMVKCEDPIDLTDV